MTLKHHTDGKERFDQQVDNAREYIVPFVEKVMALNGSTQVFDMGCGEGGVILPFYEKGCNCIGVDLDESRINLANRFFQKEVAEGKMTFLYKNIFDKDFLEKYKGFFDVIILKDVIEHIPNQETFIPYLKNFLKEGGLIFFGFPPWYMPFGGHQQVATTKLGMMPYYHILPKPMYRSLLKLFGQSDAMIEGLMEIYDTRITIERFEKIVKDSGLKVLNKQHYLLNPIYRYKFGWKPRTQFGPITHIPFFRNFVTTCVYYAVG